MNQKEKYEQMKPIQSCIYSNSQFWKNKELMIFEPFIEKLLNHGYYQYSDMDKKRRIITILLNLQVKDLQLGYDLQLYFKDLSKDKCIGMYCSGENAIVVDSHYAVNMTGSELVCLIAHEARHSYQFGLIHDLRVNKNNLSTVKKNLIRQYENELYGHYVEVTEDYEKYHNQIVEMDARKYEAQRLAMYKELIDKRKKLKPNFGH